MPERQSQSAPSTTPPLFPTGSQSSVAVKEDTFHKHSLAPVLLRLITHQPSVSSFYFQGISGLFSDYRAIWRVPKGKPTRDPLPPVVCPCPRIPHNVCHRTAPRNPRHGHCLPIKSLSLSLPPSLPLSLPPSLPMRPCLVTVLISKTKQHAGCHRRRVRARNPNRSKE